MNKNMIFKILGIVGGLLIVISLFLPYVSVTGFSQSLWKTYMENKQIYLAIIIMVFGVLPIVLYLINRKIEFSFMSVGAIGFFVIIQLIDALSGEAFDSLSFGFYSLLIGTILIAVSTFVLDRNSKINVLSEQINLASNDISNPLERSGMDAIINEPVSSQEMKDEVLPENIQNIVSTEDNQLVESLGEEIPDYQQENGVNPVISEFMPSNDINKQDLSINNGNNQISENVSSIPESVETNNTNTENIQTSNLNDITVSTFDSQPEVIQQQSSIESIQADTPQQVEITNEAQTDIFGQPK